MPFSIQKNTRVVWNRAALEELIGLGDDTVGAAGPLVGAVARLTTATVTVNQDTLNAALTKAALLGTSTVALTFSPIVNIGTTQIGKKTQIEVVAGADPTSETITGALVMNAAADDWLAFAPLPEAIGIAIEGDGLSLDVTLPFPFSPTVA